MEVFWRAVRRTAKPSVPPSPSHKAASESGRQLSSDPSAGGPTFFPPDPSQPSVSSAAISSSPFSHHSSTPTSNPPSFSLGAASSTNALEISDPDGVERTLHVEWDPVTGTFRGLPACWAELLPKGTVALSEGDGGGAAAGGGGGSGDPHNDGKLRPVKPTRRIRNSVVTGKKGEGGGALSENGGFIKRMSQI